MLWRVFPSPKWRPLLSGLHHSAIMALILAEVKNCTLKPYFYTFAAHFLYSELRNYRSSVHLQEIFPNTSAKAEKSMQTPTALC